MQRYFIYLAYNGAGYHGWQIQPNAMSVQQKLEETLSMVLRTEISVTGAGRTDTGVHASLMVAHFDLQQPLDDPAILADRLNRVLPKDISIDRIVPVTPDGHARFSALSRTYKYYVTTRTDPFYHGFLCRVRGDYAMERLN